MLHREGYKTVSYYNIKYTFNYSNKSVEVLDSSIHHRLFTCNVILRRVRITIVAVEKQ